MKVKEIMTRHVFKEKVGRWPEQDELERVNCARTRESGHMYCGWNYKHDCPMFMNQNEDLFFVFSYREFDNCYNMYIVIDHEKEKDIRNFIKDLNRSEIRDIYFRHNDDTIRYENIDINFSTEVLCRNFMIIETNIDDDQKAIDFWNDLVNIMNAANYTHEKMKELFEKFV